MAKILKFFIARVLIIFLSINFALAKSIVVPLHTGKVSLDSSGIQDISSLFVARQINCQLVRSSGSVIAMEAAKSVHWISSTKILIQLNETIKFSNGKYVTAEDVVASLDHLKKSRHVLRNFFNWIDRIEIVNNKEIVITLKIQIPQFLTILSSPNYAIFEKEFLDKAAKNPRLWNYPVGCGKYVIVKSDESNIFLKPLVRGRPITFVLNKDDEISRDEINKFDIIDLNINGLSEESANFRSIEIFDPSQIYIGLNTQKNEWKSKEARCSILAKLKNKAIIKKYNGMSKQPVDILPEGVLGYQSSINTINSLKSKYLNYQVPKLSRFCLSFLTVSIPKQFRGAYQEMLKEVYPKIETREIYQNKNFGLDFIKSKCDALIVGFKSNTLDGYDLLAAFSVLSSNFTGFVDPVISDEIESSQNEPDPRKRFVIYRHIIKSIENQCLVLPLATIPMKKIYIRRGLSTPVLGRGPLNEYDLSEVT